MEMTMIGWLHQLGTLEFWDALKPSSFQCSSGVEPRAFTSDLLCRLRSLYTQ